MNNELRFGKFTSSEIGVLTEKGKTGEFSVAGLKYIKKKRYERMACRRLDSSDMGKAGKWGTFVEHWMMYESPEIIGYQYTFTPNKTLEHPIHGDFWGGTPDGFNNKTDAVFDLKCPYTLESFFDFATCETIEEVRKKHPKGDDYYFQLVSNASILEVKKAELIVYVPTLLELENIMDYAKFGDHKMESICYFIGMSDVEELPYLPKECKTPNLLKFAFDIPESDFKLLEEKTVKASTFL